MSSTASCGWRIEGISLPSGKHPGLKTLREWGELLDALRWFSSTRPELQRSFLAELVAFREALTQTPWFYGAEVIGSSPPHRSSASKQ